MISLPFRSPVSRYEAVAFVVGMTILAFELVAARIITPYMGDTVYTWTSVIGVILAAMAFGYSQGGILADKSKNPADVIYMLLGGAVLIMLVNIFKDPVLSHLGDSNLPLQLPAFIASAYLFAAPTFLIGASTPYLSRLSITDLETSGRKLSRVDAAGTFGSLVGTFLTGYFLFGLFGSRQLMTALAVTLIVATLLISSRKHLPWQAAALALVIIGSMLASRPSIPGMVADIDTSYGRYIVRDVEYIDGTVRALMTDNEGLQSGVYLNRPDDEPFGYIRNFVYASQLRPDAQHYLVIGGGAFTFPERLARQQPAATVDTVEIDGSLPKISSRYFNFEQPENLHVIAADGRQFLNSNKQRYDMIYLDAFNSVIPPFQLLTKESASRLEASLADDGIVVANIISATEDYRSALVKYAANSLRTRFPHVSAYQVYPDTPPHIRQNLLVIASKQPISQKILDDVAVANPEFGRTTQAVVNLPKDKQAVLTDDYAPVEQMAVW